jgi:ATP-dependent 26S proteasome regulatory subunit
MDGLGDKTAIVTVATTNSYECLDKALSERPQRFDRTFQITKPNEQQRIDLLRLLALKIPLPEDLIEYISAETNNWSPAQIQEILYGMVIDSGYEPKAFTKSDVDRAIGWIKTCKKDAIGFNTEQYKFNSRSNQLNQKGSSVDH